MREDKRVEICGTHDNLYLRWQPPLPLGISGITAEQRRDIILQSMVENLQPALQGKIKGYNMSDQI